MKNILTVLALIFLVNTNKALAQTATAKIGFIVGEWKGTGWMMTRNGKEYTTITEKATCKLNCNIIAVEGLGVKFDSLTKETVVVHDAFGVIFNDPNSDSLSIRAYKENGVTETTIEFLDEKKIRWSLSIPNGGKVRFTTDFSEENKWLGLGEFNRGGDQWVKFMETNLDRIE